MYTHMGDVVRALRKDQGLTQSQLARLAGVGRKAVLNIEMTGHGHISSLESILGVLGYELEVVPIWPH